jgi:4-amino-4-deoxy-L-arabinose transferase-like glycosyltransferase
MNWNTRRVLVAALVFSVCTRVAASLVMGDTVVPLPGTYDQVSYHALALRVLGGHGFSFGEPWWPVTAADSPTAHWSFLYTFYLVAVYAVFGPHPLAARVIQAAVVGTLQPLLAYGITRQLYGERVGWLAAALTAGYAYFVYYAATLMTEPFYITAILGCLYVAILLGRSPADATKGRSMVRSGWLAVGLGLLVGAAVLLRQLFLVVVPFILVWLVSAGGRRRIRHAAFVLVVLGILILPFTLYNASRFHRFVLLNTNAGYAFFWANHPIHGVQFQPILPSATYVDLIPTELRSLDEAALDQALLRRGLGYVLGDPIRYVALCVSRVPAYFMFWPSGDSGMISNLSRVASFGLLWPFMLAGMVRAVRAHGPWKEWLRSPAFLLLAFIGVYTGIHLLSWALIRYRLPVDAAGVPFAAFAFVDLGKRIAIWRHPTSRLA